MSSEIGDDGFGGIGIGEDGKDIHENLVFLRVFFIPSELREDQGAVGGHVPFLRDACCGLGFPLMGQVVEVHWVCHGSV